VCDTIEELRLAYYELLYKCLYKIDKRLVIIIVLNLVPRAFSEGERKALVWAGHMKIVIGCSLLEYDWFPKLCKYLSNNLS
jgi:hypothetical protein